VLEHISCLCSFLERCLSEWQRHIGDQRTKLYYLNHFTTEQLVILQGELSKVGNDETSDLSIYVYPLLSKVKRNCCLKDLQRAMHLAFAQDIDVHMDEDGAEAAAAAAETDAMSGENDVNVEEFVRKMEESHFSRKLARRALEEVGPENIDNGNALYILICVALCSLCF